LGSIKRAEPSEITHFDPELVGPSNTVDEMRTDEVVSGILGSSDRYGHFISEREIETTY
jgi:hypothetical protein